MSLDFEFTPEQKMIEESRLALGIRLAGTADGGALREGSDAPGSLPGTGQNRRQRHCLRGKIRRGGPRLCGDPARLRNHRPGEQRPGHDRGRQPDPLLRQLPAERHGRAEEGNPPQGLQRRVHRLPGDHRTQRRLRCDGDDDPGREGRKTATSSTGARPSSPTATSPISCSSTPRPTRPAGRTGSPPSIS